MALNYSAEIIGTMTLKQVHQDDHKTYSYKLEFRSCNALACVIHVYPNPKEEGKPQTYTHQLMWFACDREHLRNMSEAKGGLLSFFSGTLTNIKLNLYHKENEVILRTFVKAGLKVTAYYKAPKPKKASKKAKR